MRRARIFAASAAIALVAMPVLAPGRGGLLSSTALADTRTIRLSALDGVAGFRLRGEAAGDLSGSSVAAGDVNGDGFSDLIVGAPNADPQGANSGSTYVVFGKGEGLPESVNLSDLNGENGFELAGAAGDLSGDSVSAGDVNGDGFADVIVGAVGALPNGPESGTTYVVFGRAGGFRGRIRLASLNGENGFRTNGEEAGDRSGASVSTAGDINGDGFEDVLIGAPRAGHTDDSYDGSPVGAIYVVFGTDGGFPASMELSSLAGSDGFKFEIDDEYYGNNFGWSVASAGDVNGDGFDDVAVGDFHGTSYFYDVLATYLILGSTDQESEPLRFSKWVSASSAGDFNGDGYDDLLGIFRNSSRLRGIRG